MTTTPERRKEARAAIEAGERAAHSPFKDQLPNDATETYQRYWLLSFFLALKRKFPFSWRFLVPQKYKLPAELLED